MKRLLLAIAIVLGCTPFAWSQNNGQGEKLTGSVIGTEYSVDYGDNSRSTTVNTRECAFDGDLTTYFASYDYSYTWAGLDLGEPYVITRVGWCPALRNAPGVSESRVVLGVFEGANSPDFMDALPLYIITEPGQRAQMQYSDVNCSKGFRYVRYVGPSEARCNIGELEFYGVKGEGDESQFYRPTNLPLVTIHTVNGKLPYDKVNQIDCIISVISDKGKELLTDTGTIRERGNGSRMFEKKPYRIKFNHKQRVLDAPANAKKWTLINNYSDKTLMRNMIAFEMSRNMDMPYTPYCQPVDVLLNGEFKGNYQLCDHVDVRKTRVNVKEMTPEDNDGVALTGGYFFEIDARAPSEPSMFYSEKGVPVTIKSPDDELIIPVQHNYIESSYNTMEADWEHYLDRNTFLRHFLIGELSGNTDTYYSVFMYKQRDNDTIYTGPVWDFDLAFENDSRTYPINNKKDFIYCSGGSVVNSQLGAFVGEIVLKSPEVSQQMLAIWDKGRQGNITAEHLLAFIDEKEEYLQQSQELNFKRWPIMNELVHQNPVAWGSYAAEVQNVRRFLTERLLWMDNRLGYTYVPNGIATTAANDFASPRQVFNLSGQPCGTDVSRLPKGVYIVRQGTMTRKIQVR